MKRDEKLLKYCNRRKLPFTINPANLNDRAKLGYSTRGNRCSGLSKLLQRLAGAGRLDYEGILGKGVMIHSVSLVEPDTPQAYVDMEAKVKEVIAEALEPISNHLSAISALIMDDDNCPAVIAAIASTVDKMFNRQLQMEDTLTKIASHVEAISRHIGKAEVNE